MGIRNADFVSASPPPPYFEPVDLEDPIDRIADETNSSPTPVVEEQTSTNPLLNFFKKCKVVNRRQNQVI